MLHDGEYHLFLQHLPDSLVHGPMSWGHAASVDRGRTWTSYAANLVVHA